jgi:hypothetical protein
MNIVLGFLIVVVVTGVAVVAMLLVRRRAPEGSYFSDGDRASGVFGVLATGFSVLLGFIVFLSFTTYDESRSGAEDEAVAVAQLLETAQFFPAPVAEDLTAELLCYARSVAGVEWDQLERGSVADALNPWGRALFETVREFEPGTASEQSAYDRWMDLTSDREQARNQRVHAVSGLIPAPLWIVLAAVSVVIFVYILFFADSAERAVTQGLLMGSVMSVITILLLLLVFFNRPFQDDLGGLQPDSMERALRIMDNFVEGEGIVVTLPCDEQGRALDG